MSKVAILSLQLQKPIMTENMSMKHDLETISNPVKVKTRNLSFTTVLLCWGFKQVRYFLFAFSVLELSLEPDLNSPVNSTLSREINKFVNVVLQFNGYQENLLQKYEAQETQCRLNCKRHSFSTSL